MFNDVSCNLERMLCWKTNNRRVDQRKEYISMNQNNYYQNDSDLYFIGEYDS